MGMCGMFRNLFGSNAAKANKERDSNAIGSLPLDNIDESKICRNKKICNLHNPEYLADKAPKVFQALEEMRTYSELGSRLYDWAKRANITFSEKEMDSIGLGGPYVVCNINNSITLNVGVIAHELMHCIQRQEHHCESRTSKQDTRSYIITGKGIEAGAVACQLRVLYEMKLNQHPEYWDDLMENNTKFKDKKGDEVKPMEKYMHIAEHFELGFKESISDGNSSSEAIKDASTAAYNAYFRSQFLSNGYNGLYLKEIISELVESKPDDSEAFTFELFEDEPDDSISDLSISNNSLYKMAKLNDDDFLIHNDIQIPLDDKILFGGDNLMRQAFDYVEYSKLICSSFEINYDVTKSRAELIEDSNPYLAVDLVEVSKVLKDKNDKRDTLEVMNDFAGISNAEQLTLDFYAPAKNHTR